MYIKSPKVEHFFTFYTHSYFDKLSTGFTNSSALTGIDIKYVLSFLME